MLQLIHKLWDRGVDVGVGVITSVIVGLIGLAFWQVKLLLDLRADREKQLQQDRIKKQIEREDSLREQRERYQTLTRQREEFAAIAERGTLGGAGLGNHWEHVRDWMRSNDLHQLKASIPMFLEMTDWGDRIRGMTLDINLPVNASNMARIIREIEIPKPESESARQSN
jgi:hypothetical protein